MKRICKFCPDTDLMQSVPGLETDLELAIQNGVVLDTGVNPLYNEIDDPINIRGRVGDVFDAVLAHRQILTTGRVTESSTSGSQQTGSATATATATQSTSSEG